MENSFNSKSIFWIEQIIIKYWNFFPSFFIEIVSYNLYQLMLNIPFINSR